MRAVSVIRRQWPFWDRFKGADHFFFAMQDAGECHGVRRPRRRLFSPQRAQGHLFLMKRFLP